MEFRNRRGLYVEAWDRRFFVRVNSFRYEERHKPVRRPAISIVVALNRPFMARLPHEAAPVPCRALLIGPNVLREYVEAVDADLWLFDVWINTPEYWDLQALVGEGEVHPLTPAQYQTISALCLAHDRQDSVRGLFDRVVYSLCAHRPGAPALDPRLAAVLAHVEAHAVDEVSVVALARQVGLSPSRLRALFAAQMHCTLPRYIRLAGFWKTIPLLERGLSFTEAAHAVGFHDLSHYHRVVAEVSGLSPTLTLAIYGTAAMPARGTKSTP